MNNVHPIMRQALAPFTPPSHYSWRVKYLHNNVTGSIDVRAFTELHARDIAKTRLARQHFCSRESIQILECDDI